MRNTQGTSTGDSACTEAPCEPAPGGLPVRTAGAEHAGRRHIVGTRASCSPCRRTRFPAAPSPHLLAAEITPQPAVPPCFLLRGRSETALTASLPISSHRFPVSRENTLRVFLCLPVLQARLWHLYFFHHLRENKVVRNGIRLVFSYQLHGIHVYFWRCLHV